MSRDTIRVTRGLSRALIGVGAMACTLAARVPLPPPRPPDLTPPPAIAVVAPTAADNDALRAQVLASRRVIGEPLAPIAGEGGCGIAAPLQIEAIVLADGMKVRLSPPAILRAALALTLADWVRDDLAPAIGKGDRLAAIEGTGGYQCRTRNRIAGAKLSEHALGNALDLEGFRTEKGKLFAVVAARSTASAEETQSFLIVAKKTACRRFSTVLGPGADAFHALHLHVDLEARHNGVHLCQWTVEKIVAEPSP